MVSFEDEIGRVGTIAGAPVFNTRMRPSASKPLEQQLFEAVIIAAEQAHRQDMPITVDTLLAQNEQLVPGQVEELLGSSKLQRALEDRGIALVAGGLTGEQANFLRIYLDPTLKADNAKRLKIAGVSQAKLDGWMRQDAFYRRFTELSNDVLSQAMPVAKQRVAMGIDSGNLDFIKFGMAVTGEYDPRNGPTVDVMLFGRMMLDVIAEEISAMPGGDEKLRRIGARMQLVMQNRPSQLPIELEAVVVPAEE